MILLNKEQIKHLHNKLIQETGGIDGIRDEGLLNSALSVPFQSFGGEDCIQLFRERRPDYVMD